MNPALFAYACFINSLFCPWLAIEVFGDLASLCAQHRRREGMTRAPTEHNGPFIARWTSSALNTLLLPLTDWAAPGWPAANNSTLTRGRHHGEGHSGSAHTILHNSSPLQLATVTARGKRLGGEEKNHGHICTCM